MRSATDVDVVTQVLPFALGLLFNLLQPLLDRAWLRNFEDVFDPDGSEKLVSPARWVADTAQFLPSAALTLVGIALLLAPYIDTAYLIGVVASGLFVAFAAYLAAALRKTPGDFRDSTYSVFQVALAGLNILGIAAAIWISRQPPFA